MPALILCAVDSAASYSLVQCRHAYAEHFGRFGTTYHPSATSVKNALYCFEALR